MKRISLLAVLALLTTASSGIAQSFATEDAALRRIWTIGMDSSRTWPLAQALMDSIGPRLTSTPGHRAGNEWLVKNYRAWGIDVRNEQYGMWRGWQRGITHVDLLEPRVRTLEATLLAWSVGTNGPVTAPVVLLPETLTDSTSLAAWLPGVRGKFVAISYANPSCRPDRQWQEFAPADVFTRFKAERDTARAAFGRKLTALGGANRLRARLEEAGARGVLQSNWSNDYGVNKVFSANTEKIPTVDLSCEDYGLVARLAANNQKPVVRIDAQGTYLPNAPLLNTIAEIKGTEKPNEYVMLSAHFDSWDAGSGATDNGTGTIVMMEAMRILKQVLPNPKRTILVGHWTSEEQGLNGSRAFVEDHPEVIAGLQALFNQDNGTGRIINMNASGFVGAGEYLTRWLSHVPSEITGDIKLSLPGNPGTGGTDHVSFVCAGAPAFGLGSIDWGYGTYTWHTNRDTFDKIVFEEIKRNAVLVAMLAYQAAQDPATTPRDKRTLFGRGGQGPAMTAWPECRDGQRTPPATLGR
jgi:carboxypeptidase Q